MKKRRVILTILLGCAFAISAESINTTNPYNYCKKVYDDCKSDVKESFDNSKNDRNPKLKALEQCRTTYTQCEEKQQKSISKNKLDYVTDFFKIIVPLAAAFGAIFTACTAFRNCMKSGGTTRDDTTPLLSGGNTHP
jgi:hypothetical protein